MSVISDAYNKAMMERGHELHHSGLIFQAGWKAAIEHIKATGAGVYVEHQLFMDGISTIVSVPLPVGTKLYRIPEDA